MFTSIGRISSFSTLLSFLLLSACTASDTGESPETNAPDRVERPVANQGPVDVGKLEEWLGSTCLRDPSDTGVSGVILPLVMCEAMFLGLIDSAAEMGRSVEGSKFCIARGFRAGSYQEGMVGIIRARSLTGDEFTEYALSRLKSEDSGDGACDWQGQRTLGELADRCRWFHAMAARNSQSKFRELARQTGIRDQEKLRSLVGESISDCAGYFTGFMAAGFFETDPASGSAYCSDGIPDAPFGGPNDVMAQKFSALTEGIEDAVAAQPDRADELAGPLLFQLMAETFPCAEG